MQPCLSPAGQSKNSVSLYPRERETERGLNDLIKNSCSYIDRFKQFDQEDMYTAII